MHIGTVNKTRYDDSGKSIKQTSFIVKNLGTNLPKMQFTIIKRSFRFITKLLFLDSTIPVDELTAETFTVLEPLNSSIYELSIHNHTWNLQLTSRTY